MPNPAEERVAIVDRDNRVVGEASRGEMRSRGLPHRSTYILVFDAQRRLLVQKRTLTKDVYPGYWDPCTGGVVLAGESYEESAARELAEEMGISAERAPLTPLFDFWFEENKIGVWGRVFTCEWNGPLALQAEEVQFVEAMLPADILRRAEAGEPFTPDGLVVVRRYLQELGSAIR